MEKMEWEKSYDTGNEAIDKQHRALVDLFNLLYECVEKNSPKEEISERLQALDNYAGFHFVLEEEKLKQLPANVYYDHRKEHEQFAKIAGKINHEIFHKGNRSALYEYILYLHEWILNHIKIVDNIHLKNTK